MDRHVIANMGAELGATASVFPADSAVRDYLRTEQRPDDYVELVAEPDTTYDITETIDLGVLEPLIAAPSSPGNVTPVKEVAGEEVYQVVIGSSANPGLRDFAVVAEIVAGQHSDDRVSFDVNPSARQVLQDLTKGGWLFDLVSAGARIHQAGCMGCIGMGQAPAIGRNSLRTVPRNFPGRSGTDEDAVWLCSPETAAAAALTGRITDPRDLDMDYPQVRLPDETTVNTSMLVEPLDSKTAGSVELVKGPNISSLPDLDELPGELDVRIELKLGDDISTDEILPAGARVLPLRSNIPAIAQFVFHQVDGEYAARVADHDGPHAVIAGDNYGQGSSREHAAVAPRQLGLRVVIAKSFARIHWQNLANFGIVALEFADAADYEKLDVGDVLHIGGLHDLAVDAPVHATTSDGHPIELRHRLSERQIDMVLAGGQIASWARSHAE